MHTSTHAAEMQQRQPLLCSVAHIHLLKSLIGAAATENQHQPTQESKQTEEDTGLTNRSLVECGLHCGTHG